MPGEEWNGTACEKCQIDHYQPEIGNNISCEMCPVNETAPEIGYPACGKKRKLVVYIEQFSPTLML